MSPLPHEGAQKRRSLWILYITYLLFRLAHFLLEVPTVRMVENAACHQILGQPRFSILARYRDIDEAACKTAPVQDQLSRIIGWKMSFDALPCVLSVIYFGSIADKHGPRLVLTLSCAGYLLSLLWVAMTCYFYETFPIALVWISSLFLLLGGGPFVFAAVAAAFVANMVHDSSRTTYLFVFAAMPHLDKLVSPPIATALLARNLYLPSLVSCSIVVLCIILLQGLREPSRADKATFNEVQDSTEPLLTDYEHGQEARNPDVLTPSWESSDRSDHPPTNIHSMKNKQITSALGVVRAGLRQIKHTGTRLYRDPVFGFCFVAFFLKSNAMASESFTFQYLSEKFGWPLRNTTILRFALSFGAVIATLIAGPSISSVLTARGVPASKVDLGIVRISLSVLLVCFIIAWQARSSSVFILAMLGAGFCEGLEPALQGLLSARVRKEEIGRFFGYMYTGSLLGDVTGGPMMSALVSIGRSQHGASDGYCFLASTVLFGLMEFLSFSIRSLIERY